MQLNQVLAYSGLLASIWIVVGVIIAGMKYEGYSHAKQFCSELGATGSPTEKFSPLINNYPLGLLFIGFGFYVGQLDSSSTLLVIIGLLIVVHGFGTWIAGYFPMDANPYSNSPTLSCKIHSLAGLAMTASFLTAPLLVAFSSFFTLNFKIFSVACLLASIFFMSALFRSYKAQGNLGTYQRLSYGAQLIWLSGLSIILAQ